MKYYVATGLLASSLVGLQTHADERECAARDAWIDDATTTASVKSKLVANANTNGLQIDVHTRGNQVTLSGEVVSDQEKSLAEEIALSIDDVTSVRNRLVVRAALQGTEMSGKNPSRAPGAHSRLEPC